LNRNQNTLFTGSSGSAEAAAGKAAACPSFLIPMNIEHFEVSQAIKLLSLFTLAKRDLFKIDWRYLFSRKKNFFLRIPSMRY
jgi:hypothetical protein